MLCGTSVATGARFLNTNAASTTYAWSTTRVYSTQSWAASGTDTFGSYLDMTGSSSLGANDNGTLFYPTFGHQSQWCVVELTFPAPHGFKTEQNVVMFNPVFNGKLTSGSPTITGLAANSGTPTANVSLLSPGMVISGTGIPLSTMTATGTITSGSNVITNLSSITNIFGQTGTGSSPITPGSTATGTGIPAGSTVLTVSNTGTLSSSTLTLTANATQSGTVSITFSVPTTILSVSGTTMTMSANATVSGSEAISIQTVLPTTGATGTFSLASASTIGVGTQVFVTGPNTLAVQGQIFCFSFVPNQFVASTTEIPVYVLVQINQPANNGTIPYEFAARQVSAFPNCELWLNLSDIGSDAYYQSVAQRVVANLGPTNNIRLELGNEHWNKAGAFWEFWRLAFLTKLTAYLPTGTVLWPFTDTSGASSGYTVTNGIPIGGTSTTFGNQDFTYALQAAHAFDVFVNAAVAAGFPASRIKRSFGSWFSQPTTTTAMTSQFTQYGIPVDSVHIGPYSNNSNAPAITNACNPAGYPVGTPGNLPVDAVNDYYRTAQFYSQSYWNIYAGHLNALGPLGIELLGYEVAVQHTVPMGSIDVNATASDATYHPSYYDAQWCYYLSLQLGNQNNRYGGLSLANYFSLYVNFNPYAWSADGNDIWKIADGVAQPPGRGASNQFLTSQGGAPGTRFSLGYAETNESVALQAFQDWNGQTTPFFAPTDISLTPAADATGVSTRTIVAIQFNEPMLGSTITTSTFTLKLGPQSIAGTVAYFPNTWIATFTPSAKLAFPLNYTAQVTTGVQNAEGTALATPITWGFTTGGATSASNRWVPKRCQL
jgi:Bacterial Ig-like domain